MIGKLASTARKLRGRSLEELRIRGAQWTTAVLERAHLSPQTGEHGEAWLRRRLTPGARAIGDAEARLAVFRARTVPVFFAGVDDVERSAVTIRTRWPDAVRAVRAKADAIAEGRFDLLGHTNVTFGSPVDFHRDPMAGLSLPREHWSRIDYLSSRFDHKLVWELNRQQYLVTLARAWHLTGDQRYADLAVAHLTAWLDANPPKVGVNWASSLEVSYRAIAWLWTLQLLRRSKALTAPVYTRVIASLAVHAGHVERNLSTYFSPNTHLTGEALGLVYAGTMLPELSDAERWRTTGWRVLREQLPRHVREDGVYFEQSTYYHRYTCDIYLHALLLDDRNAGANREWIEGPMRALLEHLAQVQRPDGTTPLIGDDDGGRVLPLDNRAADDFRSTLLNGALAMRRPDIAFTGGAATEELVWMHGSQALHDLAHLRPHAPLDRSRAFERGGIYVMRDGWNAATSHAVFDAGPHGGDTCGHAHADALALDISVRGRRMLVDPGTFTYTADPALRDAFRATSAHNTLSVDAVSQSETDGPFRWKSIAQTHRTRWLSEDLVDLVVAEHDGYARLADPVIHQRAVLFAKAAGYWIVRDNIRAKGAHDVRVHWQGATGISMELGPAGAIMRTGRRASDSALRLVTLGAPGKFVEEDGWVSRTYGQRERAPRCAFSARTNGNATLFTLLLPYNGVSEPASARLAEAEGATAIEIVDGDVSDVVISAHGNDCTFGDLRTNAEWVWARRDAEGRIVTVVAIGASRLSIGDVLIADEGATQACITADSVAHAWRIRLDDSERRISAPLTLDR